MSNGVCSRDTKPEPDPRDAPTLAMFGVSSARMEELGYVVRLSDGCLIVYHPSALRYVDGI